MKDTSQKDYLGLAKKEMVKVYPGITWDEFAIMANISPRAFKTYRMPKPPQAPHAKTGEKKKKKKTDYRTMPLLARIAVDRLVAEANKKIKRRSKKK